MLYNVIDLIEKYERDSQANPKRKPTNNAIILMLENSGLDKIEVNPTKSLSVANRGEVIEVVLKEIIFQFLGLNKMAKLSACKSLDLDLRKIKDFESLEMLKLEPSTYEIKSITPLANGSIKLNHTKKVLIVNLVASYGVGVYLVNSCDLVVNGSGHIKAESITKGQKLEYLSMLLLG